MSKVSTIKELISGGRGDAIAIAAPDRSPLTYKALREHVEKTVFALNGYGIGRNDRVAIVLRNGYAQTLGPPELPVSGANNPPFAQESALWVEHLYPIIVSV